MILKKYNGQKFRTVKFSKHARFAERLRSSAKKSLFLDASKSKRFPLCANASDRRWMQKRLQHGRRNLKQRSHSDGQRRIWQSRPFGKIHSRPTTGATRKFLIYAAATLKNGRMFWRKTAACCFMALSEPARRFFPTRSPMR